MTPDQILLVHESFLRVGRYEQRFARLFYARLFDIDPSLKPLFPSDLTAQGAKFMALLGLVVTALDQLGPLLPMLGELARRHVGYGVSERHYASLGSALIWTLDHALGDAFTADVRAAWIAAYGMLSTTMIAAARIAAHPVARMSAMSCRTEEGVNGFSA